VELESDPEDNWVVSVGVGDGIVVGDEEEDEGGDSASEGELGVVGGDVTVKLGETGIGCVGSTVGSEVFRGRAGESPGAVVSGRGSSPEACVVRKYLGMDTGGSSSTTVFNSLNR
jgi:hypothetical protein